MDTPKITLSLETVDTLLRLAGQRLASEVDDPKTLTVAMSRGAVSEEMRARACDEAGFAYSQACCP